MDTYDIMPHFDEANKPEVTEPKNDFAYVKYGIGAIILLIVCGVAYTVYNKITKR